MREHLFHYVQALRTELNSTHVDYILGCITRGWSPKQMRARFRQTRDAATWQAQHGDQRYRAAYKAEAALFSKVLLYLDDSIEGEGKAKAGR